MKPSVIVWDLETVPDLGGFAAGQRSLSDSRDTRSVQHYMGQSTLIYTP